MPQSPIALRLSGVTKSFPGVSALKDVSLEVRAGEVHALVGENGAGKSTLMAIAAGSTLPDQGSVEIGGVPMDKPSPGHAQVLGLSVVYQHPPLLPDLSVAENLAFAMPSGRRPRLRNAVSWSLEQLAVVGAEIDPRRRVLELSVEERHLVEIAKALALDRAVLILDEPTEPLLRDEIDRLFDKVRELASNGTAVVYISHRIPEVLEIADRLTVLRDGKTRGTFGIDEVNENDIVQLIVGRTFEAAFPQKRTEHAGHDRPILELRHFSGGHAFSNIDLEISPGEIVGLAGVAGNGQRDFIRALAGLHPSDGTVCVDGREVKLGSTDRAAHAGISYMPGDRHNEGVFLNLSVRENAGISTLANYTTAGVVRRKAEAQAVRSQVQLLSVRTPSLEAPVGKLSGGNQQKVVLARSLLGRPRVLLADEPTQGVDVGARSEIYRVLREEADAGAGVVVLSSDGIELEGLCDRVLVFSRGHIVGELSGADVTEHAITQSALTSTSLKTRSGLQTRNRRDKFREFFSGDLAPSAVVGLVIVLMALYAGSKNDRFMTSLNVYGLLTLLTALIFVGLGQQVVMMAGGIDLSVGPLAGFLVVVASFLITPGATVAQALLGILVMAVAAVAIGLVNGLLVRRAKISPVVATLATFILLQGLSLLLRPTPEGQIDPAIATRLGTAVGLIPVAFLVAIGVGLALEYGLRRARWGLELRAVGSNEAFARSLGARVERTQLLAYVACSLLTAAGAVMLMAQIGIGDPGSGQSYTLSSITAVVLGGAAVRGGRGSFIGVLLGAALIQEVVNATTFLNLSAEWQFYLVGGLTLIAAGTFSKFRSSAVQAA
jgi:ribose transport system ATP-binding protein